MIKISQLHYFSFTTALFIFVVSFFLGTNYAEAATLSVSPSTGVYTSGATFSARVIVNTASQAINAAEGSLSFNPAELSVVSITKGAIFNLWTVEPTFSNSAGTITFGGGSPTGYTGSAGTVLTVSFRAKVSGNPKVTFKNGSVLAADGMGTNVLTSMGSGSYTITAAEVAPEAEVIEYIAPPNTPGVPVIESSTHSDPSLWYNKTTAELKWSIPNGVTAARTLLDENSGSIPTKVYEPAISSLTLADLEEGVQFFHLQFRNSEGWGRVAHYRLAIDTKKPESFIITPAQAEDLSNPTPIFNLEVKDEGSGPAYYLVQIDSGEPYKYIDESSTKTITLPTLSPGHHSLLMEVFDHAGNSLISTLSFNIVAFDKPRFTEYPNEINNQVIPVIKGVTRPEVEVAVTLRVVDSTAEERIYKVTSDSTGEFTFIPDGRLSLGVYELTAIATDKNGAQSEPSEPIRIAVQQPGYIAIGSMMVSVLSVVIPLVALILVLFLICVYFLKRIKRIGKVVRRETTEALAILDKEFSTINKSLQTHKSVLEKTRKNGKLTKSETGFSDLLIKELKAAQGRIRKEIADVDDVVE